MSYVDGYLLSLPKKNIAVYRRMARTAAKVWRDHGALDYRECIGEDFSCPQLKPIPKVLGTKKNETVVFAWIVFKSRAHRDKVNAAVMQDPRLARMMAQKPPFDCSRMYYGGFETLVAG